MILGALLGWTLGCVPSPAPGSPPADPFDVPDPSLVSIEWGCDLDAETWTFRLTTDAWTGGGLVYMGQDDHTLEEHRVRSVEAEADGSADRLELVLSIVADWRDAAPGSSTRWRCADQDDLAFQAAVYEITAQEITDCRTWGLDLGLWQPRGDDVHSCSTPLDTGE